MRRLGVPGAIGAFLGATVLSALSTAPVEVVGEPTTDQPTAEREARS